MVKHKPLYNTGRFQYTVRMSRTRTKIPSGVRFFVSKLKKITTSNGNENDVDESDLNSVEDNAAKQYELPKWEFNRNADPKEIDLQNKIIVLSRAGTDSKSPSLVKVTDTKGARTQPSNTSLDYILGPEHLTTGKCSILCGTV